MAILLSEFTIIKGIHSGFMVIVWAVCIIFAINRLLSFNFARCGVGGKQVISNYVLTINKIKLR